MGRIANVTKALFDRRGAAAGKSVIVETEAAGDETRTAEVYHPPGVSSAPTAKDKAAVLEIRAGSRVVVATHNYRTPVEVTPGQTRVYSTDADGEKVTSEIDMQPDGTATLRSYKDEEEASSVTVQPDGTVAAVSYDGGTPMATVEMLSDGQVTTSNDAGASTVLHTDGLIEAKNNSQSLKALIDSLIDELVAFQTAGSPTQHTTDPGTITNLQAIKTQFAQLLK